MDTDPAFYKKFSQLLKDAIDAYEQGRISEAEYLKRVKEYMNNVMSHTDCSIPTEIQNNNAARAYYGLSLEIYKQMAGKENVEVNQMALETALAVDRIVKANVVVDWQTNTTLIGQMKIQMEDFLIDEIKRVYHIPLTFDHMDLIIDRCMEVAKLWNKQ